MTTKHQYIYGLNKNYSAHITILYFLFAGKLKNSQQQQVKLASSSSKAFV